MKIGIEATFTPHGGSLVHLHEFIKEIANNYKKSEIILYLKKENIEIMDKFVLEKCTIKIINSASYGNFLRLLWSQFVLPLSVIINRINVLFCPGNFSPILKTSRVKAQWIATIGPFCKDMYQREKAIKRLILYVNKLLILISSRTSNVVIHQAEFSKRLFEKKFGLNKNNQYIIQCGKDDFYDTNFKTDNIKAIISDISKNDFLCVSHLFPYKNIELLIEVFHDFLRKFSIQSKLYIIGKKMSYSYYLKLENIIDSLNIRENIIFTELSDKQDLKYAYSNCKLFIFPSLCESSGYTLIEAMSCGAPILASDKTAIPFTCGNAAEYFDAYDKNDFFLKLEKIALDESKLKIMKKKSLERSSEMINYQKATSIFLNIVKSKI